MAAGYAMVKPPGFFSAKRVATAAWVCEAPGCGLGSHIGTELKTTTGLRRIDFKKRFREKGGSAMPKKPVWKDGEGCKECGNTESPPAAKGLCKRCYQRLRLREKAAAPGRRKSPRPAVVRETTLVAIPATIHQPLAAIAQAAGVTVDDFAAGVLERFLTDIGVEVKR
jgi:hypothetical protein